MKLTISSYLQGIQKGTFTAKEVLEHYLQKIQTKNADLNAFIRIHKQRENSDINFESKFL